MATDRQIAANRRNGSLGRGPKTAAGKVRSSQNALKHGNYTAASREKKRVTRRVLEIERRKFRELPEEWADRAFLAGLRQS